MERAPKLAASLIEDASLRCSTHVQTRDILTIKSRSRNEGLSFLTITLPKFLEDFMICLEEGRVASERFCGWKKHLCLPAFMQGFTSLVFEQNTGRLLDEPSIEAIKSVRQVCSFFKKVKLPCTEDRVFNAIDSYRSIERDLEGLRDRIPEEDMRLFETTSRMVVSELFGEIDSNELIPHHGPGSTADYVRGNEKYVPSYTVPHKLLNSFNIGEFLFNTEESMNACEVQPEILEPGWEIPVRVTTVPKTLKGPRIIALEPTAVQMCQQAVKDLMVARIESCSLTKGHINFTDQTINQRLACEGSSSCETATLDLSAASDRVHKDLVSKMLQVNPDLHELVFATRSRYARLMHEGKGEHQIDEILYLNKFASMGSALCFPIEALFFMICVTVGMIKHRALPAEYNSVKNCIHECYVYGDDIIVPIDAVDSVIDTLHTFGCKVSSTKSFKLGRFRESCGMDAYDGQDVTPVYLRNRPPVRKNEPSVVVSSVATANLLYKKGYFRTAKLLAREVERCVGKLPTLTEETEGLGWIWPVDDSQLSRRYNPRLQRCEVQTYVTSFKLSKDEINGYPALSKCLIKLALRDRGDFDEVKSKHAWQVNLHKRLTQTFCDPKHLTHSSRFGTLTLKRRWVRDS